MFVDALELDKLGVFWIENPNPSYSLMIIFGNCIQVNNPKAGVDQPIGVEFYLANLIQVKRNIE